MDEKYDLDHWEVVSVNPKIIRGCVDIPVKHFSIYVASEAKRNKPKDTVLLETSDLCRRASQKRTFILFLVLVKPVGQDVFNVIVECTTRRKKEDRMNYWINNNYLDQKPSHSGEVESIPGTKYMLKLSGNVTTVSGFPKSRLEFHPKKQDNHQQFQVRMSDPSAFNAASVDIYEIKDDPDGKEVEEGLMTVAFRLTGTPFVEDMKPDDEDETFLGYTRDSLLRQLCKKMEEEWIKVAVLLGLSFRTVEKYRTNSKLTPHDKKFKVLQLWRETSKHRADYGVDDLVSALHRINREDLVQIIHKELETWLENHTDSQDRFYKWAQNKLTGPSIHSSDVEQPEPASDKFFVLLIDKFGNYGNINQVGLQMGLSRPETDKIFNDALVTDREHQLLRMFVAAREKKGDMFKTFVDLLESLEILGLKDAAKWATDIAEQWITGTEKEKNPVPWRQEVVHYLRKSPSQDDLLDDKGSEVDSQENKDNIKDQNNISNTVQDKENADREHDSTGTENATDRAETSTGTKDGENKYESGKERSLSPGRSQESGGNGINAARSSEEGKDTKNSRTSLKSTEDTENIPTPRDKGSSGSLHKVAREKESKTSAKGKDKHVRGSKESLKSQDKVLSAENKQDERQGSINSSQSSLKKHKSKESRNQDDFTSGRETDQSGGDQVTGRRNSVSSQSSNKRNSKDNSAEIKDSSSDGTTTTVPVISEPQEEYAEQLSHRIVDEVLESDVLKHIQSIDTSTKKHSIETDKGEIQKLRQHLESTLEPVNISADPSVASSSERLNNSSDQNVSSQDKKSKPAKKKDSSSHSDIETGNNPRFLDVLNKQLPSADSSDDSDN